jgi:hypothetical protein
MCFVDGEIVNIWDCWMANCLVLSVENLQCKIKKCNMNIRKYENKKCCTNAKCWLLKFRW